MDLCAAVMRIATLTFIDPDRTRWREERIGMICKLRSEWNQLNSEYERLWMALIEFWPNISDEGPK
jgi:hypothetical protein